MDSFPELNKQLSKKKDWMLEHHIELPKSLKLEDFLKVISVSEFAQEQIQRWPQWLEWLAAQLDQSSDPRLELIKKLESCADESEAQAALRHWRNQYQVYLVWSLVTQRFSTQKFTGLVSGLADIAIQETINWLYPRFCESLGTPANCPFTGRPQELYIIGMGKLGAQELNLSSDVDLMFAFPTEGETKGSKKSRSHTEFFTKLGRALIKLLDANTMDGIAYRVDMRLRPWGQSGPLACTFTFFERYYRDQGRDWERYAMIKARVLVGSESGKAVLDNIAQEFVYRRYLDFHALTALRGMKEMIVQEVRRQGTQGNIKLGAGGIREVEFVVQALQMIRGGQDYELQQKNIWVLMPLLEQKGLLPTQATTELLQGYEFLRDVEHLIQCWKDQQTQMLPKDPIGLERLALGMGYKNVEAFSDALEQVREVIAFHFTHSVSNPDDQQSKLNANCVTWWQEESFPDYWPEALTSELVEFKNSSTVLGLQDLGQERLNQFVPLLLQELNYLKDPLLAWQRFNPILRNVLRRSSYLVLLVENPKGFKELIKLISLSSMLAGLIAEKPYLMDELTNLDELYKLPNLAELDDQLSQQLLRIPEDDLESQMESLRHFRHGRVLRASACEVTETLPLMKVSDYLAHLAQVMVNQSFWLSWRHMTTKHGRPMKTKDEPCDTGFGVVAYGKAGGLELSYESDLDLVFLHNGHPQLSTEGPKKVDNQVFFMRLGQKLIHMLTTITPSGRAYEVDMRLRPSGNKGLLVSSMKAFEKYQREDAWTWEHQALVRARFITGDPDVRGQFEDIRHQILCRKRDLADLQAEVVKMREKMRDHLGTKASPDQEQQIFHIKQDSGGIVDIEFMVQYGVLAWAHSKPELTRWTDNVRLIESLKKVGFFSEQQANELLTAYLALRERTHQCSLQSLSTKLKGEQHTDLTPHREAVVKCWQQIMMQSPRQPE